LREAFPKSPMSTTPSSKFDQEDDALSELEVLFGHIEDLSTAGLRKVQKILKAKKSLALARSFNDTGRNALCVACAANNVDVVKLLVSSYDADVSFFLFIIF